MTVEATTREPSHLNMKVSKKVGLARRVDGSSFQRARLPGKRCRSDWDGRDHIPRLGCLPLEVGRMLLKVRVCPPPLC